MREIKFRGQRKDDKEWIYGGIAFGGEKFENRVYITNPKVHDEGVLWLYDVENETVGQYTGLKDKNGKEIYEGDILSSGYAVTFVDSYDPSNLGLDSCWYAQRNNFESYFPLIIGEDYEVMGNIYENPELLEV